MKRILLALLCLVSSYAYPQATANPAPDIVQCGNEVFDLSVQTPIILGNQSPGNYTVNYYLSMADAQSQTNPIVNQSAFVGAPSQEIYARVNNLTDGTYDIGSFTISWTTTSLLGFLPDIYVCDSYTLPQLPAGNYYTLPHGAGQVIPAGTVITTSQTLYGYATDATCTDSQDFSVNIGQTPVIEFPSDVWVCDFYVLPALPAGQTFHFSPGGSPETMIPAGTAITQTSEVFIFAQSGGMANCTSELSFMVIVTDTPSLAMVNNVVSCDQYLLPELPVGNYFTGPMGTGMQYFPNDPITQSMTIYVYAETGSIPNCVAESSFNVFIGGVPLATQAPLIGCDADGDGYASFDLAGLVPSLVNGASNVTVTFHETSTDAQIGANPVPSPYFNISAFTQTIFIRVSTGSDCFSVGELPLIAQECGLITGTIRFDGDGNGCTNEDNALANIQIAALMGNNAIYSYTNAQGEYSFSNLTPGSYNVYAMPGTVGTPAPNWQTATLTGNNSVSGVDFCVTESVAVNDLVAHFYPTSQARPGFAAYYILKVYNAGSLLQSGTVTLQYNEEKLNFNSAFPNVSGQSSGELQFAFTNLFPGQFAVYTITFTVEIPPTAIAGDVLNFFATATSDVVDATPENNSASFMQTVVNSYDPNDKMVSSTVMLYNSTEYLRYVVRFQNTGTAEAINVSITDQLDLNLDWNSFRPIAASHEYTAQRDGGLVTFSFNGINLPDSTSNEPASHGYVVFEAKLKSGLTSSIDISNAANIYFDFNEPIITNTVVTDLVELLGVDNLQNSLFSMYPNPSSSVVNIAAAGSFTVELFDVQGKKIVTENADDILSMNISKLQSGLYFVKVTADGASEVKKLIVK